MNSRFSALLLAGGKSSRMGRDKAFLELGGVPLWRRQLDLLRTLQPHEIFIAAPWRAEWDEAGCVVLADAQPDAGPLSGVVSALRQANTPLLLVLAVDMPGMTRDYCARMLSSCTDREGVVPRSEPLAAIYPTTALPLAEEQLRAGRYSMQELALRCEQAGLVRMLNVAEAEKAFFENVNTPADLAAFADA